MPHSQLLSNNLYDELNQPIYRIDTYFFKIYTTPSLPESLFPAGIPVKILEALSPSILIT